MFVAGSAYHGLPCQQPELLVGVVHPAIGGGKTVFGDVFPDVGDVLGRARMEFEILLDLHCEWRRSSSSSRRRKPSKKVSPLTGFIRPLLMSS